MLPIRWRSLIRIRRKIQLFVVLVIGMTVGALILPFMLAGEIYDYQDTIDGVHFPPLDVIVCLAGGRGRIAIAGDIWFRYWELKQPVVLYISGMGHQSNWSVFQRQLRAGVRNIIMPENVILETESSNTEANAHWFSKIITQKKWKRVLLVTSPYHMKRAQFIFNQILSTLVPPYPVQVETLSVFQEPFEPSEWRTDFNGVRVTLSEYIKWIYYRRFWKP